MARGKKKENLTPEERLQVALVPEKEQPYKVPENWCWIRLGTYIDFATDYVANGSFASLKQNVTYYKEENYAILVKTQDFANNFTKDLTYTDKQGYNFLKKSVLYGGELILSNIGSIGKVFRVPHLNKPMTLAPNSIMIKCHRESDYDLLYYYFLSPFGIEQLHSITTGTAVKKFNKTDLKEIYLPLPPASEQQRIVERIESLFTKLDAAKQKAQNALDSFRIRKTAILQRAFNGELTAQWRKEHSVGMESWKTVSVSEICHSLKYGTSKKSVSQGEVVVIRMGNLQDGEISWDDLAYSNDKEDIEKYKLFPGDVLFNRTNSSALVGKTSIYRGDYPAIYAGYLIKLDYDHSRITGDFLNYSLNTISAKEYCNSVKTDGVNQSNINAKKIGAYEFEMPSIEEQIEIVSILDGMFAKEQQAKETVKAALEQIDLIKKTILARAFRGELGTNDPREESSVELLKRSFSETISNEEVTPKQVIKSKAKEIFMPKTITEALLKGVRLTPEQLKNETKLSINDFYAQLKELIDNGKIVENRENGESYLEVANENRQIENQQF